ncbi:putative transmembrane protein [Cryptosporidium felis]|nr:putative transmembrane protein [Cryptosporidium felis]
MAGKIRQGLEWTVVLLLLLAVFISYDQYFFAASIGFGVAVFVLITDHLFLDSNQFIFDPFYNNWVQRVNNS